LEEGETFVEGQVYMEFKTKSAGGKRRWILIMNMIIKNASS
jgi:hypothetical protein